MNQYPPPPQPDHQHYNPIYPPPSATQPGLEHSHLGQLAYADHQSQYPKVEHEGLDPNTSIQIEQRIEQLHHEQSLGADQLHEQLRQHVELSVEGGHQDPDQQQDVKAAQAKLLRLRKACDSCSIRKVKCDESGPPCRACASLDIPCTFERPSRRRGPPNRHAEAIKRRRLEDDPDQSPQLGDSPTNAAQALAALSAHPAIPAQLSAESILPVEVIDLLINDYFTYIHPLNPFPHEPSFREAWRRREDFTHRPFLALLASMIAALVASFPRKPRQHLKAHNREKLAMTQTELVNTCYKVCSAARGPGYLESPHLSVHDAATSYLLGMAGTYAFRWRTGRLYLNECMTIIKALGLDKAGDNTLVSPEGIPSLYGPTGDKEGGKEEMLDNITLQVGRRVYWTLFVASRSLSQLGAGFGELYIPPSNPTDPYPPLPLEVEDFCIFPGHIDPQPEGRIPVITGFNANVRIFLSYQPLTVMELAWGIDKVVNWERQKQIYHDSLATSKSILAELPTELKLNPGFTPANEPNDGSDPLTRFHLKMELHDPSLLGIDSSDTNPEQRRRTQMEIQKANIYASELSTRSYIVEKFFSSYEARGKVHAQAPSYHAVIMGADGDRQQSPILGRGSDSTSPRSSISQQGAEIQEEMAEERERIVRSLLTVLSTIDRVNMEPNGDSFAHKIRFIASTLLDVPTERKSAFAQQAEEYLKAFLDILVKLDRVKADANANDMEEIDEAESKHWADLREYQARFAQEGGIDGV